MTKSVTSLIVVLASVIFAVLATCLIGLAAAAQLGGPDGFFIFDRLITQNDFPRFAGLGAACTVAFLVSLQGESGAGAAGAGTVVLGLIAFALLNPIGSAGSTVTAETNDNASFSIRKRRTMRSAQRISLDLETNSLSETSVLMNEGLAAVRFKINGDKEARLRVTVSTEDETHDPVAELYEVSVQAGERREDWPRLALDGNSGEGSDASIERVFQPDTEYILFMREITGGAMFNRSAKFLVTVESIDLNSLVPDGRQLVLANDEKSRCALPERICLSGRASVNENFDRTFNPNDSFLLRVPPADQGSCIMAYAVGKTEETEPIVMLVGVFPEDRSFPLASNNGGDKDNGAAQVFVKFPAGLESQYFIHIGAYEDGVGETNPDFQYYFERRIVETGELCEELDWPSEEEIQRLL